MVWLVEHSRIWYRRCSDLMPYRADATDFIGKLKTPRATLALIESLLDEAIFSKPTSAFRSWRASHSAPDLCGGQCRGTRCLPKSTFVFYPI